MKITYKKLIEATNRIALDKGIETDDIQDILGIFFGYVIENVSIGNDVCIMNFGSFYLKKRPGRKGWDMVNKKKIMKEDKYSMGFKASGNVNTFIHNTIQEYVRNKRGGDLGGTEGGDQVSGETENGTKEG